MHALIVCEACSHGAYYHHNGKCEAAKCACERSRNSIIEDALEAARRESVAAWPAHRPEGAA